MRAVTINTDVGAALITQDWSHALHARSSFGLRWSPPLCVRRQRWRGGLLFLHRPEDHPHQVAFEAAERLLGGLPFSSLLRQVGASGRMDPGLGEDDLVERGVQLAVAIRESRWRA